MLAQSFKSAAELKISEKQFAALQKVLVLFETEQINYGKIPRTYSYINGNYTHTYTAECEVPATKTFKFNLAAWIVKDKSCGTVACIGGAASMVGNVSFVGWSDHSGLSRLFNPASIEGKFKKVSVTQAARALRNYLTTGYPRWREVMKEVA
jgi:hypothetical protein